MSIFDAWQWGYCQLCKFMVQLAEDGTMRPHKEGRAAGGTRCDAPGRAPDPTPRTADRPSLLKVYKEHNAIDHNTLPAPPDKNDTFRVDLLRPRPGTRYPANERL